MSGAAAVVTSAGCASGAKHAPAAPQDAQLQARAYACDVSAVDTRFVTRDHFMASLEMQLSGEPLATAMGRDTTLYVRDYTCQDAVCSPDAYPGAMQLTDAGRPATRIDLAGFSSAVESYEYSKQPMNNISFESGAGTSLLFGPVLNPERRSGAAALQLAQDWFTHMASESNASRRVVVNAAHPLGWPGFWPILQPFDSWDPRIAPAAAKSGDTCSLTSDDNHGPHAGLISNDYECDYTSLNLPERGSRVSMRIGPGASGWTAWKQALWALNYLQVMHDVKESAVDHVTERLLSDVGVPGNTTGPGFSPGTYLGSSNIEGFQAGVLLQMLDNQAAQWLFELNTPDGRDLGGFASLGEALGYALDSPLRWFAGSIAVQEAADDSGFARPERYSIMQPDSQLLDLAGLLGAYASVYALTDAANSQVGGSQAARAYFDDDPFPKQPEQPNGEPSLHDRSLAMLRVVSVDMARLHVDPGDDSFRDSASVSGQEIQRGSVLSSDVAAYALLALRTAQRALGAQLTLYSNTTPDTAGIVSPLDRYPLGAEQSHSQRLRQLIEALSSTFYDKLSSEDGHAFGGWDYARAAALDEGDRLDAHTAAIRGLLSAYLATGSTRYRDRAHRVFQRLESAFYDPQARIYRPREGERTSEVTFTPRRFGLLQAALRDSYELIALLPGQQALRSLIESRLGRLNKLVLNGWDDRNRDERVDWPSECAHLGRGPDGEPLGLGGLQMGERTLTGETGALPPDPDTDGARVAVADRDHDCVPEISAVGLPAALASSITFRLRPLDAEPAAASDAGADAEEGSAR